MRRGFFVECPLTRLSFDIGHFGLLAAREDPGFTAELDQHAAAVRDSIEGDGLRVTRSSLTHYLHGFVDGCRERDRGYDSVDYDWETLRLLAICRMAKEYGFIR
ncbi:DUF6401 family natural product biosynthesis protein [Marinactinospora rubrisoli]|uniref:DUF6401 family natural product biosynthesis protein n=1 Tax=Marinactinospora rubrisoli TaxID=2715399 RepID=A0ABW2KED9_9ACTN